LLQPVRRKAAAPLDANKLLEAAERQHKDEVRILVGFQDDPRFA
jgi:hypothetical protein